jgi:hypothetical protein
MRLSPALVLVIALLTSAAQAQAGEQRQHLVWLEPASTIVGLTVNLDDPDPDHYSQSIAGRVLALSGGYAREHTEHAESGRVYPGFNGYSAQAGLDLGYQWQLGHFYIAPMLGLALGASYNIESIEPFITGNSSVSAPDDTVHLAMGLNLHLLRVGWAL